jgi:hypothetical protein
MARRIAVYSLVAAVLLLANAQAQSANDTPLCEYAVTLLDAKAHAADVTVTCHQSIKGFRFTDDFPTNWVSAFTDANGVALRRKGSEWRSDAAAITGARYHLDLDGMTRSEDDYDSAKRSGNSVLVDLSGVIAIPIADAEAKGSDELSIRFAAPNGGAIATSLPLVGNAYRIRADEIDFASALILGTFQRRTLRVPLPLSLVAGAQASEARDPAGEIELLVMDGAFKASTDEIADWVRATALANADLWHGFPVARSTVVILPVPGEVHVPTGHVIATGGIMVFVQVGAEIAPRALYDEWVLVHEFIHLGTPYIRDTGEWFNEGLATYLEPIIRYRAGWRSAESVWEEWTGWMGRGLEPMTTGLENGNPYWGGALFALTADIQLRRLTGGRLGLEDCARLILAKEGDVSVTAKTMGTLAIGDSNSPEPVLTRLAAAHLPGAPMDLDALFASLGVHKSADGKIEFDDSASLADVRHWILEGGPGSRTNPIPIPVN